MNQTSKIAFAEDLFKSFAFGVGDVVAHKSNPKQRFSVLKRAVSENAGGYERTYTVFGVTGGGESPANTLALFDVGECEIQEYDAAAEFKDD